MSVERHRAIQNLGDLNDSLVLSILFLKINNQITMLRISFICLLLGEKIHTKELDFLFKLFYIKTWLYKNS